MSDNVRKVCVVTGSRAEFGILRPVIEKIRAHARLQLQLLVTGMHLAPEFGETWREIEADGIPIDARVEMLLASDTPVGMAKSTGLGVISFTESLQTLSPDIILLLGDRFEIMAVAQAAFFLGIPIAHISGGELTEGAVDDVIRHCITKMASLHFSAAEAYRKRIIQLGENPERVFNVGDPALDNLRAMEFLPKERLLSSLGLSPAKDFFLVTYHPVTAADSDPGKEVEELWTALSVFSEYQLIVTAANADAGGRLINARLREFCENNPGRAVFVKSLGQKAFFSALNSCKLIIGNSSAGIVEAPALKVATVNIGPRQQGRLKAASIIDCPPEREAIIKAIHCVLAPGFQASLQKVRSLYGNCNASEQICQYLAQVDLSKIRKKAFHDVDFTY